MLKTASMRPQVKSTPQAYRSFTRPSLSRPGPALSRGYVEDVGKTKNEAWEGARLGAPGDEGCERGRFQHPVKEQAWGK